MSTTPQPLPSSGLLPSDTQGAFGSFPHSGASSGQATVPSGLLPTGQWFGHPAPTYQLLVVPQGSTALPGYSPYPTAFADPTLGLPPNKQPTLPSLPIPVNTSFPNFPAFPRSQVQPAGLPPSNIPPPEPAGPPNDGPYPADNHSFPTAHLSDWDGFPNGAVSRNFTYEELGGYSSSILTHWATYTDGGNRTGHVRASTWKKGMKSTRTCLGIIECLNPTCEIIIRPQTKPSGREKQLAKPCECGGTLRWKRCGVKAHLYRWRDGIYFEQSGRHIHAKPPRVLHLSASELQDFEQMVLEHPELGPRGLQHGIQGMNGPCSNVKGISPALHNYDRVVYERKHVTAQHSPPSGDSFFDTAREFALDHPGFLVFSSFGEINVASFQTSFMRSQLLHPHIIDGSNNGILSDGAHGFWKWPNCILMTSSTYVEGYDHWVPGLMSFLDGSTKEHFRIHFYALMKSIVYEAELRDIPITDKMFSQVSVL